MPTKKNYITKVAMPAINKAHLDIMTTLLEGIIKKTNDPESKKIFQDRLNEIKKGANKER